MTINIRRTLSTLQGMRCLLVDPNRWTKRAEARDAAGTAVDPHDPNAVCFCLTGAAHKETWVTEHAAEAIVYLSRMTKKRWGIPVSIYNDTRMHGGVMYLLDTAIAELESTL